MCSLRQASVLMLLMHKRYASRLHISLTYTHRRATLLSHPHTLVTHTVAGHTCVTIWGSWKSGKRRMLKRLSAVKACKSETE
jgi:hypothetical protein